MKKNSRLLPAFPFAFVAGVSVVLLAAASPSSRTAGGRDAAKSSSRAVAETPRVGARTFARVTRDGIVTENLLASDRQSLTRTTPKRSLLGPLGNTLWMVDDDNA